MEGKPVARLLLVDDHVIVRQAIGHMLQEEPDLTVVGQANDGTEAIGLCDRLRPDLVLMDRWMPGMDGLEATRVITSRHPEVAVLILTMDLSPGLEFEARAAGASGCLRKLSSIEEVLEAVRRTLGGRCLAGERGGRSPGCATLRGTVPLSRRERAVLQKVSGGQTNAEIAASLHVSVATVKAHVARILKKLCATSRTQAAVKGYRLGILEREPPPDDAS